MTAAYTDKAPAARRSSANWDEPRMPSNSLHLRPSSTESEKTSKVEPQYSEEARKRKLQGSIVVNLVIDTTGVPTQIVVIRPLGMGLDELAVSNIAQWRFAPGTRNGTPVDRSDLPLALTAN
jgi:TonB family protein